jgi:ABC-2 type transport system permease protein
MNTRAFPLLVRREFWEHRALWMTPVALAAIFVLGCIVLGGMSLGSIEIKDLPQKGSPSNGQFLFVGIQLMSTGLIFILTSVVTFFYLSDCLYAERKDRSILFWKSLPVSDTETVVSKLVVASLIVPLGVYFIALVANILAFIILSLWIHSSPFLSQFLQWDTMTWLRLQGLLIVNALVITLWYLPVAAYQLLISAWARTSVFVWTVLPPLALSLGEWAAFRTWHIGRFILGWLAMQPPGGRPESHLAQVAEPGAGQVEQMLAQINGYQLLATPALWIGLIVAAALIFATIRVRRLRDDS